MSINYINNGDSGLTARTILNQVVTTTNTIDITYNALQDAINANSLVSKAFYKITDADPNLYGGTEVLVQADSNSTLSSRGIAKFYNPKYDQNTDGYGIWSPYVSYTVDSIDSEVKFYASIPYGETVIGYKATSSVSGSTVGTVITGSNNFIYPTFGDWDSSVLTIVGQSTTASASISSVSIQTYSVGDTTIWGGKVWINKTGNIGSNIDAYTLNSEDWDIILYDEINYNISWDEIEYDVENNFISLRKEISGNNIIEQSYQNWVSWDSQNRAIAGFQWGNTFNSDLSKGLENNYASDSYIELINFRGSVCYQNSFTQYAYVINNNFELNSEITNNQIINSYIYENFFGGNIVVFDSNFLVNSNINTNVVLGYSKISNNNITNTVINQNVIANGGIIKNSGNNANINYNGIFNDSQIVENNLASGDITCNNLSNQSLIAYNSLNLNSIIANNNLGISSEISRNTLSNTSQIVYNTINNNGLVNNNNVSNLSVIYYNDSIDNITNNIISNYYYLENTSVLTDTSFIKAKNIGETLVNGGYALNFGLNNIIRSELGVALGSGNYIGGITYNGTLTAQSTNIDVLGDITSIISPLDIIYITSNLTGRQFTREVVSVGTYSGSITPIVIDTNIDDKTTSIVLSQNLYGNNSLTLGENHISTGNNSLVIGDSHENNTSNSIINGVNGYSKFDTDRTISGQMLNNTPGSCQSTEVMISCITDGNEVINLTLNDNKLLVLNNYGFGTTFNAFKYKVEVLALETNNGDVFTQTISGLIVDKNGTLQEIGSQIISETINDPTFGGSIIVSADDTTKSLRVQAVGEISKTFNWVAKVTLIQTLI